MKFYHIMPSAYIRPLKGKSYQPSELTLAHLVDEDEVYTEFYCHADNFAKAENNSTFYSGGLSVEPVVHDGRILDNSAYELYRAGLPMFDGNKLVDLGKRVSAEYIVLPDYPAAHPIKTINAAYEFSPKFKEAGFKSFFVPQGRIGNYDDYESSFAWAARSDLVDYIGISIIAGPNAYGVDKPDSIQTFLARMQLCESLFDKKLIQLAKDNGKKIHFLGMTDGPKEILEARRFPIQFIDTWDSSAATWAGIEDVRFDNTPTGLINGKVKSHVDFSIAFDESKVPSIIHNISTINEYVRAYNRHYVTE